MVFQIQVKGIERTQKLIVQLPRALNKEMMKVSDQFTKFVRKSAKLRAPRITGKLAESIRLKKIKKNEIKITVDSPYGIFQEYGFTPHLVSAWAPTRAGIGLRIGEIYGIPYGYLRVARHKPFIRPALEMGLNKLPSMLSQGAKNAIQKARG